MEKEQLNLFRINELTVSKDLAKLSKTYHEKLSKKLSDEDIKSKILSLKRPLNEEARYMIEAELSDIISLIKEMRRL